MKNKETLGQEITVNPSTDDRDVWRRLCKLREASESSYLGIIALMQAMISKQDPNDFDLLRQLEAAPRHELLQAVKHLQNTRRDDDSEYTDLAISLIQRLL